MRMTKKTATPYFLRVYIYILYYITMISLDVVLEYRALLAHPKILFSSPQLLQFLRHQNGALHQPFGVSFWGGAQDSRHERLVEKMCFSKVDNHRHHAREDRRSVAVVLLQKCISFFLKIYICNICIIILSLPTAETHRTGASGQ